ncbi:hypothetical protein [Acetobacterium bakii]|uniref:DUF4190 domain-containing protein n=1 Tax=Acetobacterium bakii TaxID=52689 RepID=A0A0L6U014_9FIRM|nr:hypothetical protein [Acetobacterium bakii]KNZ41839.1 hypothetical protein AKG39_09450 [Acetobacterium bakii]
MSFEFGMKGYTFGMIALICLAVNILLTVFQIGQVLSSILGLAVLVLAILAFVYGKKELAADPENGKAKTGKTIGLVVIIVEIVLFVISLVFVGILASMLL